MVLLQHGICFWCAVLPSVIQNGCNYNWNMVVQRIFVSLSTNVADGSTAIVTADLTKLQLLMMLIPQN